MTPLVEKKGVGPMGWRLLFSNKTGSLVLHSYRAVGLVEAEFLLYEGEDVVAILAVEEGTHAGVEDVGVAVGFGYFLDGGFSAVDDGFEEGFLTLLELLLGVLLELLDAAVEVLDAFHLAFADELAPACLFLLIVVVLLLELGLHAFELLFEFGDFFLQCCLGAIAAGHDLHEVGGVDVSEFNGLLCECAAAHCEEGNNEYD